MEQVVLHRPAFVMLAIGLLQLSCKADDTHTEALRADTDMQTSEEASPGWSPVAEQARRDLAEKLQVSADRIQLVRHSEVTWRDGSLGCPRPGMAYTQALVNGTLVVLRHAQAVYEYHAGPSGKPFFCANPEEPLPPRADGSTDV